MSINRTVEDVLEDMYALKSGLEGEEYVDDLNYKRWEKLWAELSSFRVSQIRTTSNHISITLKTLFAQGQYLESVLEGTIPNLTYGE